MNFSQKLGLFILIMISLAYIYFSFFNKNFENTDIGFGEKKIESYNPLENLKDIKKETLENKSDCEVRIFLLDKNGELRSVKRVCEANKEISCVEYSIKELLNAPSKIEKSKGYTSEIPQGTKILSIRESSNTIMIDLSSNFESGGGAESTYMRIKQLIKTANANTSIPTYLYINGKQANVIGGEGIMIKQPLNERSFDE